MPTIVHSSDVPSFLAPVPAFTFFELAIVGQLVNHHVFESLGEGWYRFKLARIDLYAPGWERGYGAEDVAATPVMARELGYAVMGVAW